jgi:hypothetical protein
VDDLVPIIRAEATALEPEDFYQPRLGRERVVLDVPFIDAFGDGPAAAGGAVRPSPSRFAGPSLSLPGLDPGITGNGLG